MVKQNIRQGDGRGATGGFRGGKGRPGYPVPDNLKPEPNPESVVEDIVTKIVLGLTKKKDDDRLQKARKAIDLVQRHVIDSILGEAESPEKLHKGIEHLEDLKPDQFMKFLEKYIDLPIKGGLEVSEKVDGSARISFGVSGGKIWTQSKNGPKKTDPSQYGDKQMFRAIKMAHEALRSREKEISKAWPKNIAFLVAEVLYTKIPNSIEYGPNVIMVHGVHDSRGEQLDDTEAKNVSERIISSAGKLSDGHDEWLFEYKRLIRPEDVMVDVKSEYGSLKDIYDELKKLEPNKLKAVGKAPYKAALEKFRAVQLALKKKLLT